MFKVNSKATKTTAWGRFGGFIVNFEHISHLCSSVSIVNFEHVIAGWDNIGQEYNAEGAKWQRNWSLEAFEATEAFEYKNARSDFLAITEKNEKQYVRLQLRIPGTQGVVSPVLIVLLMNQ